MEQPALPEMKYSRAVIYKIDQVKRTVEQVWEYGKERGHNWYSPVTSLTEYQPDKNSVFVYSATAGADFDLTTGAMKGPFPTRTLTSSAGAKKNRPSKFSSTTPWAIRHGPSA